MVVWPILSWIFNRMPRRVGPERAHFGGEDGLITELRNGKVTYSWKCDFCGWKMGGKQFANAKARIHLSGENSLRNGVITKVCSRAPAEIKEQFVLLERQKRLEKTQWTATRKRAAELMNSSPAVPQKRNKQSIVTSQKWFCVKISSFWDAIKFCNVLKFYGMSTFCRTSTCWTNMQNE